MDDRFRHIGTVDVLLARAFFFYGLVTYASWSICACSLYGASVYLTFVHGRGWEGYGALRPPRRVLLHCSVHAACAMALCLAAAAGRQL